MRVLVENNLGVLDEVGTYEDVQAMAARLNTGTTIVGNRIKFEPTRPVLDLLVAEKAAFHPGCRYAWAHFYRKKAEAEFAFDFKTVPFEHQSAVFNDVKDRPWFALEWEMGLGKSKEILDLCAYAASMGEIDALFVNANPGKHVDWVTQDVPEHLSIPHEAAYWQTGKKGNGLGDILKSDKFIVVSMNFEMISRKAGTDFIKKILSTRKCAWAIDESQNIANWTAERVKVIRRHRHKAVRRYICTGTATPQGPLSSFSQYWFLSEKVFGGMDFNQFKNRYCVLEPVGDKTYEAWEKDPSTGKSVKVERPVTTVTGHKNLEELRELLDAHRSVLLKDDVLNLPEKIYRMRSFEMTPAMRKIYMGLFKDFLAELDDGRTVTAQMAITRLIRLQQVACGFVVTDDSDLEGVRGEAIDKKNPRLEALMTALEQVRGKGIIWSTFRFSLREIADALRTAYGDASVVEYHGGTSAEDKQIAKQRFEDPDDPSKWFVSNQQSGGTGITLLQGRDSFYYNNSHSLTLRLQSEDRPHRIGQKHFCTYTDIECLGTADRPILRALKGKRDVSAEIAGVNLKAWLSESV